MASLRRIDAFLLSREWRDASDGVEIVLWARAKEGPVRVRLGRQEGVMFVPRDVFTRAGRREQSGAGGRVPKLLTTLDGRPVDAVYFRSQRALMDERDRLRDAGHETLESDIKPSDRFVMERFVTGGLSIEGPARERSGVLSFDAPRIRASDVRVDLSLLALDIETDGASGPILSAALSTPRRENERVFVRGARQPGFAVDPSGPEIVFAHDEPTLLRLFFADIVRLDPDVLCGWNVTEFDLTHLERRARELDVPFAIGRGGERGRVIGGSSPGRASVARVPGRVVLDGIATLKSATYSFERFTLEHVSRELLGRGKTIAKTADPIGEIRRLHAEDVHGLAAYNIEDCRLVLEIFEKADLLGFAAERARLTGLAMDRQGGSVAAFDHLYLPRIHRRGVVAPDVIHDVDVVPSPGGHVLDSTPGLYEDVLSFDFRSLYPSIIRTFRIDPLGLAQPGEDPVAGEEGALFARSDAILPELISMLHDARSAAMATKNAALSRAIKILMNSFYGVLGTPGCRFFDSRLPTSITRRGHAIIERARRFFEDEGMPVIYGDTDSVFVHFTKRGGVSDDDVAARGRALAAKLTAILAEEIAREHRVESHLELRFESHYLRFLMPTTRGTDRGSKKRYAGIARKPDGSRELVMRGLEAVRRDWTPLAREAQRELFRRVFAEEPFEDWLRTLASDLHAGKLDEQLVYRKRLRRELDAYARGAGRGAPHHVQAARMLEETESGASEVEYVMTTRGPEPLERTSGTIDYPHYVDRQLAPACDVILSFLGTSFEKIAGSQTSLF